MNIEKMLLTGPRAMLPCDGMSEQSVCDPKLTSPEWAGQITSLTTADRASGHGSFVVCCLQYDAK